ncbi:unnamed protein product [Triticum turgidum subsp. durum]|uniref:Alcohol dehydrogenase n=1 Tax=Triticum turgidum subsp. durum TaxID=4567 RepID=A0A9R0SS91_TRITD|nr:unnamed protein product [Triticum turgidum subsp. durum]
MEDKRPKPIRCRAAVCRAAGEPLAVEEVVVDPPKAHELRLKIVCTSLCHSDVTFWRMKDFPGVFPRIFGHEAFGVVESVGEHVEGFAAGDAVVPTFLAQCSECADCRSPRSNVCSKYRFAVRPGMPRDDTTRFHDGDGNPIHHLFGVSSFSEYTVVDVTQGSERHGSWPRSSRDLRLLSSASAPWDWRKEVRRDTLHQPERTWGENCEPGDLLSVLFDCFTGGRPRDLVNACVEIVRLDTCFFHDKQVIIEMTDGGADYCFECIGLAALMNDAFQSSRPGWGKTIILGVEMHGAPLTISSLEILHGKCVMGSLFGGVKPKQDIPILADKYLNKELELDKFITHEVGLEDINTAFDLLLQGKSLRCTIWMDK